MLRFVRAIKCLINPTHPSPTLSLQLTFIFAHHPSVKLYVIHIQYVMLNHKTNVALHLELHNKYNYGHVS